jgi:uncharacterized protein (TIGR02246 family)
MVERAEMIGRLSRWAMMMLLAALMASAQGGAQNADEVAVRKAVMGLPEAWNRHDMKAFAALFTEDADFVNVAGSWWKGRAEIEEKHSAAHATIFRESTLSIDDLQIRFLTPEIAVAHVSTLLAGQKTLEGAVVAQRKTLLTLVLQRQSGKWAVAAAHNTDVRPALQPAAPSPKN